jgi:hypothetical protein
MKAEELIEKMNLHKINVEGDYIVSEEQLETFAEAYHQHRVNAISDEDIEKEFKTLDTDNIGFYVGVNWFKEQLLKR